MNHRRHVSPLGYVVTFVVLLVLSGITLALSFFELGVWSVAFALVIAAVKAVLVALFFMHLIEQKPSNRLAAVAAVVLLALLVGLMIVDVDTRPALGGDVQWREKAIGNEPDPPSRSRSR